MNPSTTVGRYPLSTRFTANVRSPVSYPERSRSTRSTPSSTASSSPVVRGRATWDCRGRAEARGAVDVFERCAKFSVDEQRHYLFTPRDLTAG